MIQELSYSSNKSDSTFPNVGEIAGLIGLLGLGLLTALGLKKKK